MNIGDKIPELLGIDQDGNEIKLSDYKGKKIVLYFVRRHCSWLWFALKLVSLH